MPENRNRHVSSTVAWVARGAATRDGRYDAEGWRVCNDGTKFWALVVIDAIRDEQGNLLGFAKVTRDMTERMQTQQALRHRDVRLALTLLSNAARA